MSNQLILVDENGNSEKHLYPIAPNRKVFDETFLQQFLISNPDILPVSNIDSSWGKMIPLGREVSVTAGAIDNLYISKEGLVCIVETKLWRNPEAHRTVVAQIIDYAKDLSQMSLMEFKETVEKSQLNGEKPPFKKRISKCLMDIDEIEFESKLQECLASGRFLLLIVGDKIHPEVAMLVETIQSAPNLEFKLGMIEIQAFQNSKEKVWPILVIPKVVGKTHEVIRAVVRITYEEKKPSIEVDTIDDKKVISQGKTNKKTFLSTMSKEHEDIFAPVFEKWIDDGFNISWGSVGFSVRFMWKGKPTSIVTLFPNCIGLLVADNYVKEKNFPLEPYHTYREAISKIPAARKVLSENRVYVYDRYFSSVDEYKALVDETDKLVRSFKKYEDKI